MAKKNKKLYKSITHIKLELANTGKLDLLDELGSVYLQLVQSYIVYKNIVKY